MKKMRATARADELSWHRAVERGRSSRAWEWIAGGVFGIVIILTGYRLVQTQQHLDTMQSELESAKQAADQAKVQATAFAKRAASLNSELEKRTLNAMSFRPNWITPRLRSNEPNLSLRTNSLV